MMWGIRIFNGIVCGLLGLFFFNAGMLTFDIGWVLSGFHEADSGMLPGFLAVFFLLAAGGFIGLVWLWDVPEARDTAFSRVVAVRFVFGCLQWSVLLWVSLATVGVLLLLREDAGWSSPLLWRLASCVPIQLAFLIGCVCWYRHMMLPAPSDPKTPGAGDRETNSEPDAKSLDRKCTSGGDGLFRLSRRTSEQPSLPPEQP